MGGASLFSLIMDSRMCGNSTKLHQRRVRLDIRKILFIVSMVKHCNRLPREVVGSPQLSVFKMHLDSVFNNFL